MAITINNIQYTVHQERVDIICIPVVNDDHTLVLRGGYAQVRVQAYGEAKFFHQTNEIAHDLMSDYVLENESELVKIDA